MKKKPETERKQVIKMAEELGLYCEVASPGDGVMRYKFYEKEVRLGEKRPVFMAVGIKEAKTFLYGVMVGKEVRNRELDEAAFERREEESEINELGLEKGRGED